MRLVEAIIYQLIDTSDIDVPVHVHRVDPIDHTYPLILIRRISTVPEHVKDTSAVSEDITIQITVASKEGILHANDISDQITSLMHSSAEGSYTIGTDDMKIHGVFKTDDSYTYDDQVDAHNIHTDFLIRV